MQCAKENTIMNNSLFLNWGKTDWYVSIHLFLCIQFRVMELPEPIPAAIVRKAGTHWTESPLQNHQLTQPHSLHISGLWRGSQKTQRQPTQTLEEYAISPQIQNQDQPREAIWRQPKSTRVFQEAWNNPICQVHWRKPKSTSLWH